MKSNSSLKILPKSEANCLMAFKYLPNHEVKASDILVPLEVLYASEHYQEVWLDQASSQTPIQNDSDRLTPPNIFVSPNYLVYSFQSKQIDLAYVTELAYDQAYQISKEYGYPHLIRTWNYLHDINGSVEGLERYQSFCVSRHAMLAQHDQLNKPNPAATAIGSHNGVNLFVFLFARSSVYFIENKRQVSAWNYPKHYAPKQPRFSRAMRQGSVLMCSGTASVVGHETMHLNDVHAQLAECLKNVAVLLAEDGSQVDLTAGLYRFYIRHAEQANEIREQITGFGIKNFILLHGDVCRENLLIECEVVFQ